MKRYGLLFFGVFFSLFCVAVNTSAQDGKMVRGGVLNGKAVSLVKPAYPPAARAVNAGGSVNVQITIDELGNVVSASAVSGHPLLKSVSEEAAKASKFSPTTLSGEPVKVTGILVYNFTPGENATNIDVQNNEVEEALNGQATKLPSPAYPPAAKAVNASGKVRVKITLDEKGNVATATAVSGHPLLRASAEKAAKAAKFDSADVENRTVNMDGVLIYVFFPTPKSKEN